MPPLAQTVNPGSCSIIGEVPLRSTFLGMPLPRAGVVLTEDFFQSCQRAANLCARTSSHIVSSSEINILLPVDVTPRKPGDSY